MKHVYIREIKLNFKSLLIWSLCVAIMGLACILMYQSMQTDIEEMADMFSGMGAFADAFGMSTLSIATLKGFFATEVGTIHGLGGAMFAAMTAITIVSKEEERHSGEFLLSLPLSRNKVLTAKGLCVLTVLVMFTLVCGVFYVVGFAMMKEPVPMGEMALFLARQLLLDVEIGGICFMISAFSSRIRMGAGLGLALVFYVYDILGRVVPDLKDWLFAGPFSYANASEIFSDADTPYKALIVAAAVTVVCVLTGFFGYGKRDLAS